ncbi:DUF58 domain-containing protein [Georgenia subflava]|uniref:DUF58 domain-containing protein n=2 Tax=Georgenia subflava TaxID=1622177 RepID=A0A6N7EJG1_9MICO|nr:DUF58 domain-containing protein [Georgenia subflava]
MATARVLRWVSAIGWGVLLLGLVAWAAGARLGWVELVAGGVTLLAVFACALAFTLGRQPYEVDLRMSESRVVVGERAMAGVVVRNTAAHHVLPARIELPVGAAEVSFALPGLARGGEHEELFAIPTARRAVIEVGPVRSVRGDPLGLVRRAMTWTDVHELYVHPRTVRLASTAAGFLHDLEGQTTRDITSSDLAFHALREYIPGDDRRYIHWRSSARTGTLMVRQFEETRRSHIVVALSRNAADYTEDDELEIAISTAGSLGLQAIAEEKDLTLLTSHEALPVHSRRQLLDSLTRLEPGTGPGGVVSMAQTVSRDVEHASMAILICGSAVTAHSIRAAGAVLPLGVRAVAVRVDADAEAGVSTVGVVTVVTVGALDELPRALRKAMR